MTAPGLGNVKLTLIDSVADVIAFNEWLESRPPYGVLSIDTETTGLNVRKDQVRLIQIGDSEHGWAFARHDWLGVLRDAIQRWDGRWVLHNALYDVSILHHSCDIDLPRSRVDDTMVMARINEPHMSMALKTQASRHVDPAAAGLQVNLGRAKTGSWTWATIPIENQEYWTYAALDPVLTQRLYEHHWPITSSEAPKAYDLEMATLWVIERMQDYGVCVDVDRARKLTDDFASYCTKVETWCRSEYGVSPGSHGDVVAALQRDGVEFTKTTKGGAYALDVEVLSSIDHPLAQAVLNRRQIQKMASTYVHHYAEDADVDWLLYPSINSLGARTSRMSMADPNLQNLPRRGTTRPGDVVRDLVISRHARGVPPDIYDPRKHGALVMCDFGQIEMRILAHLANEPAMLEAFRSTEDFFVALARQIYEDNTITKKDPRRQITKNAGYATIFGAGVPKFAQTAGVAVDVARRFMARWHQLYPGVQTFQQNIISAAVEQAELGQPCGARSPLTNRWFVADDVRKAYVLTNYVIQGTAAEILKMKLCELSAAGLGEWMVAPVHDEIILDVPGEHVTDVVHTLRSIMNDDKLLRVPITAEVSYGRTWGEKREWVDG